MELLAQQDIQEPTLERRRDGQLWLSHGGESCVVRLARCFPWSSRSRFISLRDDDRKERLLIEDPATLDADSRAALEAALVEADFVLAIERVLGIEEEIEIRCWSVETSQGKRSFQTRRDEWPRPVPGGGVLIRDVAGDLYCVTEPAALDGRSRQLLGVYID